MSVVRIYLAAALALLSWASTASAEKRVALVVGNSAYVYSAPLANPVNDAGAMAKVLTEAGFEIVLGLDLDKASFDAKVREFARKLDGADVGLFFYAGHGLQIAGRNYLVPIDAAMQKERDLDFEGVNVDLILKQMELDRADKMSVVFLDACRDNPLAVNLARSMGTRSASIGKGLAQVATGVGTFISYSTQPGNVALDGKGKHSPFTAALVKGVQARGQNLTAVMVGVRKDVLAATAGKQVPWDHSSLTGDFYFHPAAVVGPGAKPGVAPPVSDAALQERLQQLEQELKKKSDPAYTAKTVELAQIKEQLRSSIEANKSDQMELFEIFRDRTKSSFESSNLRSKINMRMARRYSDVEKLRARIADLEKDLGLPPSAAVEAKP